MWFIGVEVEQETSAPPPKKNPGSAPVNHIIPYLPAARALRPALPNPHTTCTFARSFCPWSLSLETELFFKQRMKDESRHDKLLTTFD